MTLQYAAVIFGEMRMETISAQLRRAIIECGLSRYFICKKTGVDEGTMSKFMSGKSALSLDAIDRIGQVLGLTIVVSRSYRTSLTIAEVARRLHFKRKQVLKLVEQGILRGRREDEAWVIDVKDLNDYQQQHRR